MLYDIQMAYQHLAAETDARINGRPFMALGAKRRPNANAHANAHVKAQRQHKIDQVLDHFINNYSLACRVEAGGPL